MLTPIEKTALDIIEVFENGTPDTYGNIVCLKGDTGGLSGGLLMATLRSGNLGRLLRLYRDMGGTLITEEEVRQTEARDESQNTDPTIRAQFKKAANDPIMQECQEIFFGSNYLKNAKEFCAARGFVEPLTLAVTLDGFVQGSFKFIAGKVPRQLPEREWVKVYVQTRKRWLAENANTLLHRTVYRMETFEELIRTDNWGLLRPFTVHGYTLK